LSQKTIDELNEYRSENAFNEIWRFKQEIVNSHFFLSPKMTRKRSLPVKNIGGGSFHPEFKDVEDFYRIEIYYLILDTITQAIKDKFNENDLKILYSINNILVDKNTSGVSDIQEVIVQYMDLM